MRIKDDIYQTGTGQILYRVHEPSDQCENKCVMHSPSDHKMKDWPTNWRQFDGILTIKASHMERICPHGIGHPDPDSLNFIRETISEDEANFIVVHGCDGCCT